MNKVFFAKEGLTATSANHVANIAKEYAQRIATQANTLRLYTKSARLLGDTQPSIVEAPLDTLDAIPDVIRRVAQCNALIGWLREAINEREKGLKSVQDYNFKVWADDNNIALPEQPEAPDPVQDIDKVGNEILNVKELNRYIELKTRMAVYGKYIHPDGILPMALKRVSQCLANPTEIKGEGRDMVVFSYNVELDTVDRLNNTFFKLQSEYRALQAEFNGIEHRFRVEAEKEYSKRLAEYKKEYAEYQEKSNIFDAEMSRLQTMFVEWKQKEIEDITSLRIIIPNDLQGIYAEVNGL